MKFIHLLYMLAATASVCAGAPQLRKLVLTKRSAGFSLPTWMVWLATQVISLAYALSVHDRLYAVVSSIWVAFYAVMVVLIVRYREADTLAKESSDEPVT